MEDESTAVAPRLPAHHGVAARDLVARLLCVEPHRRLRSLLALRNIAFFKGFKFDEIREMKISPQEILALKAQSKPAFLEDCTSNISTPSVTKPRFQDFDCDILLP
ncbi:hypothetical protein B566_EDAN016494 [Ephemera danica]|nr:hypothetical protein B566_EDAN016494 [Ephemera danica]